MNLATAPVIRFEEEGHQYFVDGRAVRSWSSIIEAAGLGLPEPKNDWERKARINAKHRGRQIHEAANLLLTGRPFNPQDLDDESIPYVQAFVDYWRTHGVSGVSVETPLYNPELDYCCTPDFHTPLAVYDIKTTDRPSRTWGLQTAAQSLAHGYVTGRWIIWLRPKLKTKNYEVLTLPDARVFTEYDFDVVREVCRGQYDGPAITAWKALR